MYFTRSMVNQFRISHTHNPDLRLGQQFSEFLNYM